MWKITAPPVPRPRHPDAAVGENHCHQLRVRHGVEQLQGRRGYDVEGGGGGGDLRKMVAWGPRALRKK